MSGGTTKPKSRTFDHGLKKPCLCGSGRKFKSCCYETPKRGWAWIVMGDRLYSPIVVSVQDMANPVILAHQTYCAAFLYAKESDLARVLDVNIYVSRWTLADLEAFMQQAYPVGTKMMAVIPPEISLSGEGEIIETEVDV